MPSFPYVSLPVAVQKTQQLYSEEGQHPADRDVVSKAIGYGTRNGASDGTIAALLHYGLVDEVANRNLKISRLGLDIVLHERGEAERATAIRQAAFMPDLFNELYAQFGERGFSDRNLIAFLVKKGFGENAAKRATKAYRDTVQFVEMESRGVNFENQSEPEEIMQTPQDTSKKTQVIEAQFIPAPPTFPTDDRPTYRVGKNRYVQFSKGDLSKKELDRLIRLLQEEREILEDEERYGDDTGQDFDE